VPTYLKARAAAGHAVPRVEVVMPHAEAGEQREKEERHAVLEYVVNALSEDLASELLRCFHSLPPLSASSR
jgi:hypothetical protein